MSPCPQAWGLGIVQRNQLRQKCRGLCALVFANAFALGFMFRLSYLRRYRLLLDLRLSANLEIDISHFGQLQVGVVVDGPVHVP